MFSRILSFAMLWVMILPAVLYSCDYEGTPGIHLGDKPTTIITAFVGAKPNPSREMNDHVSIWQEHLWELITVDPAEKKVVSRHPASAPFTAEGVVRSDNFDIVYNYDKGLVFRKDGPVEEVNIGLIDEVKGQIFSDTLTLILQDSYRQLSFLQFEATGELSWAWTGGPLLTGSATIAGGHITGDGELVIFDSSNQFNVVDIVASKNADSYVVDTFEIEDVTNIRWLDTAPGNNFVMAATNEALMIIDIENQSVTESIELTSAMTAHQGSGGHPHVLVRNADLNPLFRLYLPNEEGEFDEYSIVISDNLRLVASAYDAENDLLYLRTNRIGSSDSKEIIRLRGKDSRILSRDRIEAKDRLVLSPNYILRTYESKLGRLDIKAYGSGALWEEMTGFNLERFLEL